MAQSMQFDVSARDSASPVFARIAAAADRLHDQLKQLDRLRATPTVRLDTGNANAEIGELRRDLDRIRDVRAKVKVSVTGATAINNLVQKLARLRDYDITVRAHADQAEQTIARLHQRLSALRNANVRVRVDVDLQPPDVRAQLLALRALLQSLRGSTTHTVNIDRDGNLSRAAASIGKVTKGLAALFAIPAAGAAVGSVASLAGGLAQLSGVAGLLPGALTAAGVAAATLKVGLTGVGDALKETDPAKFAEAIKKLAPSAAEFARSVRDLQPAFHGLRLDVQQALFAGLGEQAKRLGNTYLPVLKSGMTGVATELGGLGKEMVGFATSSKTVADVETIFRNTGRAIKESTPAAANLSAAFRDIAVVGTSMLPELASGFSRVTDRFAVFIAKARETGQLREWIQGGLDRLAQLGRIAGNVGGSLGAIFTAATASGADFLITLERATAGLERMLRSTVGQSALTSFFRESRAAIDALTPGLTALADGALRAIQAFSNTGALQAAGQAFSDVATAVAPLLPALGTLAGDTVSALAAGFSTLSSVLGPVVAGINGLLGALGPLAGVALATVAAFVVLRTVFSAAAVQAFALSLGVLAERLGASAAASTRLASVASGLGRALPLIGAGIVLVGAAVEQNTADLEGWAKGMLAGGEAARKARQEFTDFNAQYREGSIVAGLFGKSEADLNAEIERQRNMLPPLGRAQSDVALATDRWNEAVQKYTANSPQAAAAADELAAATARVKAETDKAAAAAQSHTEKLQALADAMRSQVGAALAYEQAVRQTAEAHKQAGESLKKNGAQSDEYKGAVLNLAGAMISQADAARAQGEALGGAEAGVRAFNTEILRTADTTTQQGRDAFIKIASAMDTATLATLSATAKMSGLKTEIITLPDGRQVTVVVNADRAKLDTVKQDLERLATQKFAGTVTIDGDPRLFGDKILQSVTLANGTKATMTIDGNGQPLEIQVGQNKYKIDSTTGVMTIDGNPAPGVANLNGFKVQVDSTTGAISIDANTVTADGKIQQAITLANGSTGVITIDANQTPADGKITGTVTFANGQTGIITIDGNQEPANGKITASVQYADGSTGIIQVDANTDAANAAIDHAARPRTATITVTTIYSGSSPAQVRQAGAGGGLVGYARTRGPEPIRMARGGVLSGYQPGRDTVPAVLSKGEAVLVPELVRQIGPKNILAANYAASGRAPTFWSGGGVARFAAGGMVHSAPDQATARAMLATTTSAHSTRPSGSGSGRLLEEMRQLNGQLRALRGDVDHHGDNASISSRLDVTNRLLANLGSSIGSAAGQAQAARTMAELGAF